MPGNAAQSADARGAPAIRRSRSHRYAARGDRLANQWGRLHKVIERANTAAVRRALTTIADGVMRKVRSAGAVGFSVDDVFRPSQYRNGFIATLTPALSRGAFAGAEFEAEWIDQRSRQSIIRPTIRMAAEEEADDDVPSIAVELSEDLKKQIREWLKERNVGLWEDISDTLNTKLRRAIQRGLDEGDSFDDLQKRLQGTLKGYSDYGARRIARTEATGSLNAGQQFEREDIGIDLKRWLATIDRRTRGASPDDRFNHLAANGQVVKNDAEFKVSGEKLKYPGDSSSGASGGNVIQCRCVAAAHFE